MKKKNILLVGLILTIVTLIYSLPVNGGITGKIRGMVKDSQTGASLPGVNVIINKVWINDEELDFAGSLGAATNIDGEFIILKVPPGIYSVIASMIGYNSQAHQRVKVSVDRTTNQDFSLTETVLELGETVVVEAKRDMVQLDVAATENYVTAEEYQKTPFANRIEDVIGLQSGITGNIIEGDIKIREGETREVGFLLDGMDMVDQKFNRPVMSIQTGIVQEIKIMRNGFSAEYGQSRSGVINVITRSGDDRFHCSIDYQFDPANRAHYGRDKYDPNWNLWRLYAGPKAFVGDTLITPDGRYDRIRTWEGWNKYAERLLADNNPDNDLTAQEAFELWKWRHRPLEYGNINGHNIDLALSGPIPALPWQTNFLVGGKYEYHPFFYPQSRNHYDEKVSSVKLVNNFTNNIKLTLNGIYAETKSISSSDATSQWNRAEHISYHGGGLPDYYPFFLPVINKYSSMVGTKLVHTVSPRLFYEVNLNYFYMKWGMGRPDSARAEDGRIFHGRRYYDPQSGWIPKEKGIDDDVSGYRMHGGASTWENSWNRRIALTASMVNQFHSRHELKLGFDINYDQIYEDRVHWHEEDSTQAYIRKFDVMPIELGIYLQDKIEFEGMIANLGLRFDYFNTHSDRPDPHRALEFASNREIWQTFVDGNYPTVRAKPKYYLSPRLGISHPLSERGKIYFNYGHFVQTPPTFQLYVANANGATPSMLQMGDSNIPMEKTIAYELGCDIGVSDFLQFHIGAFYKENFDLANSMTYAHSDQSLVMDFYGSIYYADIRGIEIEIRKTMGRFITGWLNYNYIKKSTANLSIPGLSENPIITDDPNIGNNGIVWGVPRSDEVLIEPYARGVITFMAPPGWGPRLKGYSLLSDTHLSFQIFYQGGPRKRHPRSSFYDDYPDVWFKELDRYWADLRLSRLFRFKSLNFDLYLDISNVLHTRFRYPPGGQSGEDYYDDLWQSGRLDQVGTDKLADPMILRTENDDVWWAKVKEYIFGLRVHL